MLQLSIVSHANALPVSAVFRPGNGSSSATNAVLVLVVNQISKLLRLFHFTTERH